MSDCVCEYPGTYDDFLPRGDVGVVLVAREAVVPPVSIAELWWCDVKLRHAVPPGHGVPVEGHAHRHAFVKVAEIVRGPEEDPAGEFGRRVEHLNQSVF
jgi:hypothetical protein